MYISALILALIVDPGNYVIIALAAFFAMASKYVFNIKGNQYRLIALIIFDTRTLFILFIGTHNNYNKINAAEIQYKK